MARWGEGDPRWIVEERADAKNVNNWHWVEKNADQWSEDKLKELLTGFKIDTEKFWVKITRVNKCDGYASLSNRKAKLVALYDWKVEMDWEGGKNGATVPENCTGTIELNNLSEENSADELEFDVYCKSSKSEAMEVKEFIRKEGVKYLRKQVGIYIMELTGAYAKDLILPTKDNIPDSLRDKTLADTMKKSIIGTSQISSVNSYSGDQKYEEVTIVEDFMCTPEDLYHVFVAQELTSMFTNGPAIVDAKAGGDYSIYGGNVQGEFTNLDTNKQIRMTWRKSNWPVGHFSQVKMEFKRTESGTRLTVTQTNVPSSDKESTQEGWKAHYFRPIQQTFGFGGKIF